MPQLNKEKLDQMVEAVMNDVYIHIDSDNTHQKLVKQDIRTALTPFCMEMTDGEIKEVVAIKYGGSKHAYERGIELGFEIGVKFVRDGK